MLASNRFLMMNFWPRTILAREPWLPTALIQEASARVACAPPCALLGVLPCVPFYGLSCALSCAPLCALPYDQLCARPYFPPFTFSVDDLAKVHCCAVAKLSSKVAELVAAVAMRGCFRAGHELVARQVLRCVLPRALGRRQVQ